MEIYGADGAKFLWETFDQQTIDDCVQETAEWRKPAKQREAEEIQEDHEKFITENPELVEDLFANEIAELGFDPGKWKKNYASSPETTEAVSIH